MKLRSWLARSFYELAVRLAKPRMLLGGVYRDREAETYYNTETGIPRLENFEAYSRAYTSNPWINACVKARAEATAAAPLKFYRETQVKNQATGLPETVREEARPRKGTIVKAFKRPNPFMTASDIWEWITAFLLLDGNAYLAWDPKTKELWPLIPERVRIVPHRTRYISHYVYTVRGEKQNIDKENIFHFKRFNPENTYYGIGDLLALYYELSLDSKMKRYLSRFFDKGARLSGIVEVNEDSSKEDIQRLEFQFNQQHGGAEFMHQVAFLAEGMKWKQSGQTNRDLQIGDLSLITRDAAMAVFRTPPAIVNRWDNARFSNSREQVRMFYEGVQSSFWMKLASTVSQHELVEDEGVVGIFDMNEVPQLRESDDQKSERGRILIQSGQWTINEVRRKLWQMPPVKGGDQIIVPKTGRNEDMGKNDPKADQEQSKDDQPVGEQDPKSNAESLESEVALIEETMNRLELEVA